LRGKEYETMAWKRHEEEKEGRKGKRVDGRMDG
jgi:hypothetical protein